MNGFPTYDGLDGYEKLQGPSEASEPEAAYELASRQNPLMETLRASLSSRSSVAFVAFMVGYGPNLAHIGSSSMVVDRRRTHEVARSAARKSSADLRGILTRSVVEQVREMLAALSLNKSQLAQVLSVSRPTIYDWFHGKEPNPSNAQRLHALLGILARAEISSKNPLNARFVRQATELGSPSLLDLLSAKQLDEDRILFQIERAKRLGASAADRRKAREDRLRKLGFEEPTEKQRKEQLAKNVSLKDWPKQ